MGFSATAESAMHQIERIRTTVLGKADYLSNFYRDPAHSMERLCAACGSTENYVFTKVMTELVSKGRRGLDKYLLKLLQDFLSSGAAGTGEKQKTDTAFAAVYALSIYYKHYDKPQNIKGLIDRYHAYFSQYPLWQELLSRYYKRIGEYEKALECDRKAIAQIEPIENYGVYTSFASTVCGMYEKGYQVTADQREKALHYIRKACQAEPSYPTYHGKLGVLLLFTYDLSDTAAETELPPVQAVRESIEAAKACFEKALECASEREQYYTKRILDYQRYLLQADMRLIELQMRVFQAEQEKKEAELAAMTETLRQQQKTADRTLKALARRERKLQAFSHALDDRFTREQHSTLEILAIFVAIIQVVTIGANLVSAHMTLTETVLILIAATLCALVLYLVFLVAKAEYLQPCREQKGGTRGTARRIGIRAALAVSLVLLAMLIIGIWII